MCISLYTSRVVLNALGADDYGIYNLVGGIVVLFTFLNGSMSGATSRYLTVGLAKNDSVKLHKIFSSAVILHLAVAAIIFFLAETIGLWLLATKLNIPEERMDAAIWAYQFSIVSSMISITQVPYNASLIAHEKLDIYAIVDVLGSLLKLGVAFLIQVMVYDKLILYSGLILSISFIVAMTYRAYCHRHYLECCGKLVWDKRIGFAMSKFSGWNLYSSLCFTGRQQGTNMLLNVFGGTVVNAAAGLASSVQGMVEQASMNLVMASRPQIIKQYAIGDHKSMAILIRQTCTLANMLYLIIAVPFLAEINYVMHLWLVKVPQYTIEFCSLMIMASFISLNTNIVYTGIQATGKMKLYSFIAGTTSILVIPVLWICLHNGVDLTYAFGLPIISNAIIFTCCIFTLHYYVREFNPLYHILKTTVLQALISSLVFLVIIFMQRFVAESFARVLLSTAMSSALTLIISYCLLFTKDERNSIVSKIRNKIRHYGRN